MKIAIVHFKVGFAEGGTENVIKGMAEELAKKHEIHIHTTKGNVKLPDNVKVFKTPRIEVPCWVPGYKWINLFFLILFFIFPTTIRLLFGRYDVISTHYYIDGFIPLLAGKIFRTPTVFTFHGALLSERYTAKLATKTVAVSDLYRKIFAKYGLNPHLIYSPVNTQRFKRNQKLRIATRKDLGIKKHDFVVITIARNDIVKGPEITVDVIKKCKGVKFIIIGIGKDAHFNEIKNNKNIFLFDQIQHEEIIKYYSAADASLMICKLPGINLVILESMACELPIIASSPGGTDEIITKESGFTLPLNPYKIVGSINKLKRNRAKSRRMGKIGRRIILKKTSWREMSERYEKVFLEAMK